MDMINMIKFQLKLMVKTPIIIIFLFFCPVILTASIGYLSQNSFGSEMSSYTYYSISMMIFVYIAAGIISSFNFIDKPIKDGNFRLIFTPASTSSIYISQILSTTMFSSVGCAFSMIIFSTLFNVDYNGSGMIILLAFIALSFMSSALGVFLCTLFDDAVTINVIFNIVQTILCALGGAFFSIEALGKIPAAIAKISPVKWLMDGILNSMYDNSTTLLYITVLINILLGIIIIMLCKTTFKTEKYI